MPDRHSTGNPSQRSLSAAPQFSSSAQWSKWIQDEQHTCQSCAQRCVNVLMSLRSGIQVSVQDVLAVQLPCRELQHPVPSLNSGADVYPSVWLQSMRQSTLIQPRASQPCRPLLMTYWGTKHQTWINAEISCCIKTDRFRTKATGFAFIHLNLAGHSWKRQH